MTDSPTPPEFEATGDDEGRLRGLLNAASRTVAAGDAFSAIYAVRGRARRRRFVRAAGLGCALVGITAAAVVSGRGSGSSAPGAAPTLPPYRLAGALTSFNGCTDYLDYVRDEAAQRVGPYGLQPFGPYGYQRFHVPAPFGYGLTDAASGAALESVYKNAGAPVAHSATTVQVAGVDEPDTVKTDGRIVVSLTGPTLRVLDTHATVLGTVALNGDTGGGLLLAGDQAVVLSTTSPPPSLVGGFDGFGGYPYYYNASAPARAAIVDLSDPHHPRLERTFEFDGAVVAARLVDGQVRLVLRSDGPRITFQTPSAQGESHAAKNANRRLVAASTLGDWLPAWRLQKPDGSTTARQPLAACNAVARPRHASGISTVSVLSLDPQSDAPGAATSVVAAGDTVYATADHVYVAGLTQRPRPRQLDGPRCCTYRPARIRTWIYDFTIAGADRPRFVGAGPVPGSLLNSYAMDQDERGYLRVVSTVQTRHTTDSRITVLALSGRKLAPIGVVDGLGHRQEVKAVRFLGDAAYVVTFRTFDPLYVVDLRDPRRPVVSGRLEQPGFSEFLYPLPGDHLLGVGVALAHNEASKLLVSTYDVSDPAHPRRDATATLAHGYFAGYGNYDPHAFLYWPATDLAVVALPGTSAGRGEPGAGAYRIGAGGGLTRLATLAHRRLAPTRTVVVGTELWSFTAAGVLVADLDALGTTSWHPY
ncbi:MAG: hypothetical protein QOJ03_2871 [Frankiaceae bacterium]|jgi:hypothetical protein|nr:hypothetical protein [Frankiaceae bacterium]